MIVTLHGHCICGMLSTRRWEKFKHLNFFAFGIISALSLNFYWYYLFMLWMLIIC